MRKNSNRESTAYFRRGGRVGDGNVKLDVEFVFKQILNVPAFAPPLGTVGVRLEPEPVIVGLLVVLNILDQRIVLLFEPLNPLLFVPGTGLDLEQWNARQSFLGSVVHHVG